MNTTRRTRARITADQQYMIMVWALEEPQRPRQDVARKLQSQFRAEQKPVPEIAVLERKISHYRSQFGSDPLTAPWSIESLSEHPVSPEGLPVVLEACEISHKTFKHVFTARDAMWVDRLRVLFQDRTIGDLTQWALRFAKLEARRKLMPKTKEPSAQQESDEFALRFHLSQVKSSTPVSAIALYYAKREAK